MKTIFTLLLSAGIAISAAAQPKHSFDKGNIQDQKSSKIQIAMATNGYGHTNDGWKEKERQARIINAKFDREIAFVNSNWHINRREKSMKVHMLETRRNQELSQLRFGNDRDNHEFGNSHYH